MIKTAVIIAGGAGTRLRPLTDDIPKALVPIGGKPLLHWTINWLKSQGIENLIIGIAYKKEKIYEYMEKNDNFGLNVKFSEHTVEGGTAQGFKLAISRHVTDDDFLAMNCDEITNLDISKLFETHKEKGKIVTMAVSPFHCRFSTVGINDDGVITGFKYGHKLEDVPISIGIYIFNKKILDIIPETGSIEDEVFAKLSIDGKMAAHRLSENEEWISVNNIKNVKEAEEHLEKWGIL